MSPKARTRTTLAALAAGALLLLPACGGSDDSGPTAGSGGSGTTADEPTADELAAGVPEECADLMAMAPADLADVEMLPADWPEPPVEATLCVTTSTVDNGQESMEYATDAAPADVLAGYEQALASYGAQRDQDGLGRDIVVGAADDVNFQVTADDGSFTVVLAR